MPATYAGDEDMPTESRSAFLLVRSDGDLERASEDLAAYLSILGRRLPASDVETVQGIWIDEEGVANLPCALVLPDAAGARRTVRILETTGINGIWMLCWLETAASAVSRVDLVAALLDCFGHEDATTLAARFIPVFAGNAPDSSVSAELQVLEARYPELVLPPIYQDAGGSLVLPSAQPHDEGTPS
ncbi:hypothetical protein [Luteimonas terricola]|uniref:DUF4265 domain-containing protein n=1 Tax=Luteimonas terricola TaxID=645597 RepID=A0ABQ2EHN4_9GAMM|nr:hypothetical protein [Luteimonas terricola]GGK12746.1 hypothetical protein GCM10011394_22510 [Luteimonas terricola]